MPGSRLRPVIVAGVLLLSAVPPAVAQTSLTGPQGEGLYLPPAAPTMPMTPENPASVGGNASAPLASGPLTTRIGTVALQNGLPSVGGGLQAIESEVIFQRALQVYLWGLPLVTMQRWMEAHERAFSAGPGDRVLYEHMPDIAGFLTPAPDVALVAAFVDLSAGPVVVEVPAGKFSGSIVDFWQRPVSAVGQAGPDRGRGGRYLLLGPGQKVPALPPGYQVVRPATQKALVALQIADPSQNAAAVAAALHIGDFTDRHTANKGSVVRPDSRPWSMVPPAGMEYWQVLSEALQGGASAADPIAAQAADLGLAPGATFAPSDTQAAALKDAADVAPLLAATLAFARPDTQPYRRDSRWFVFAAPQKDAGAEATAAFFYQALTATQPLSVRLSLLGESRLATYRDASGDWFDGGRAYRLRIPANVPVSQYWTLAIYDSATRGPVENIPLKFSLSSREGLRRNADGTVDILLSPAAPAAGGERNWLQTVPGRAWFAVLSLHGPLEAASNGSWKIGDIAPVAP